MLYCRSGVFWLSARCSIWCWGQLHFLHMDSRCVLAKAQLKLNVSFLMIYFLKHFHTTHLWSICDIVVSWPFAKNSCDCFKVEGSWWPLCQRFFSILSNLEGQPGPESIKHFPLCNFRIIGLIKLLKCLHPSPDLVHAPGMGFLWWTIITDYSYRLQMEAS